DSVYGLEHGRLHLRTPTPMWMNMGYWGDGKSPKTMAEACRDLLKAVLKEAGLPKVTERAGSAKSERRRRTLIDLGVGCGDQTIYLMSDNPVRPEDREFDHYVGMTKDLAQSRYAKGAVDELYLRGIEAGDDKILSAISLFCADATSPTSWDRQVKLSIDDGLKDSPECWMLALDTAYHFTPSRWPTIKHAYTHFRASFMAFDLCLSPTATATQKLVLRFLTALMGAPWANFGTPEEYRQSLIDVGYSADAITIVDISEHVFAPLASHLADQDSALKKLGLSIGSFNVAKSLFGWWGRSGVVRGIIVVAR
ncbi:hypothetical protein EK21DRAFT_19079, partial [Setomelanomma holmii]